MVLRLFAETLLGSTLSITGLSKAEAVEKKLAGGKAFSVRAMISRQMLMALTHRKLKKHKKARQGSSATARVRSTT
jgi:hypothetical protein